MRAKVVQTAKAWLGCRESDGSHRPIIDLYNSHKPLARGYKMTYTDAWCAAFVSAVSIECGITDIMPTECGCDAMIALYKKLGRWQEADNYTPQIADVVFYDWGDTGVGDNAGSSDHVGIVANVNGKILEIIEGNISDKVAYRTLAVNARYIRGYGLPDYERKAAPVESSKVSTETAKVSPAKTVTLEVKQLSRGMTGAQVKTMQLLLIGKGFSCGVDGADGDYGANTDKALRKFQNTNGLTVDGICGANTWDKLIN